MSGELTAAAPSLLDVLEDKVNRLVIRRFRR